MPKSEEKEKASSPKDARQPSEAAARGDNAGHGSTNDAASGTNGNGQASQRSSNSQAPRRRKKQYVVVNFIRYFVLAMQSLSNANNIFSTLRVGNRFAVSTRWEQEVAERGQPSDIHSFCCCCARRVGNMFILLEYADGSPIVVAGPCWPFCLFVTVPLIVGISGLVSYFLVLNEDSGLVRF